MRRTYIIRGSFIEQAVYPAPYPERVVRHPLYFPECVVRYPLYFAAVNSLSRFEEWFR